MPRIKKTKYAVLGMLSIKPMSGYDIKQYIDFSISYFWNENYGNLYPVLRQIEKDGLADKQVEQGDGKPNRNIYYITEKGKKELLEWLMEPVNRQPHRIELLLKLFFGHEISAENCIQKLQEEKEIHEGLLREYENVEKVLKSEKKYSSHEGLEFWLITLSYGKHDSKAKIAWCEESIKKLEKMKK